MLENERKGFVSTTRFFMVQKHTKRDNVREDVYLAKEYSKIFKLCSWGGQ